MVRWALLMSPDGGDELHVEEAGLPHQGHRRVDKTSKCEDRSWTSSSSRGGSVLGFPQYGSSCLWKRDDGVEELSASILFCVQPKLCSGNVHTRVQ